MDNQETKNLCQVRKDLVEQELGVPVGNAILFQGGELKACHKTNLQLFNEVWQEFTSPVTWREIEKRKLTYLFNKRQTRQEFYEALKIKNIDLSYVRGENDRRI